MIGFLDCFSGVSGDMLLGALVDAGAAVEELRAGLAALPLSGWRLEVARTTDRGLAGTRARVVLDDAQTQPHRHLAEIEALLVTAALPERARARALAVFRKLAEAEAAVHGTTVEAVEFHEVGAVDSIVDITGMALGLELLGIDDLYCSSVPSPPVASCRPNMGACPSRRRPPWRCSSTPASSCTIRRLRCAPSW